MTDLELARQYAECGLSGRCAEWPEWPQLRPLLARLAKRVERLEQWISGDCECPCCGERRECEEGCTFAEDCPNEYPRMESARAVLYGGDR